MENRISGNWWEYKIPFRHFRAFQVLNPTEYNSITSAFSRALREATSNRMQSIGSVSYRKDIDYEGVIIAMNARLSERFKPFFERTWIEKLSQLINIPFLPRIDGALHSHPINSNNGMIHSDYSSAWFDESVEQFDSELLYPDHSRCEYFTGKIKVNDAFPKEYVRAASMIYYLCNDGWQEGEGGDTGLFEVARPGARRQAELVPPLNNSLLFFEINPHSYHSFITNSVRPRNSLILFLHSTTEFANRRWGTHR
jgi:hypothetical protein